MYKLISLLMQILVISILTSLIVLKIYVKLTSGWCKSSVCLKGKTALITGANAGIGYQTALDLAKRGARVILACRNELKGKLACQKIIAETLNEDIVFKQVDFTSFKSIKKFAEDINVNEERLDILVNNAGVCCVGNKLTEDGLLIVNQVNYYAHFLVTNLLLDLLKKSSSRIINITSLSAKYVDLDLKELNTFKSDLKQYGISKLCVILFTIELASRLKNTNVTTYSLHPGIIKSDIFKNTPYGLKNVINFLLNIFFKTPLEGAQTSIYLAVENNIEQLNGEHFHDCHLVSPYPGAYDRDLAKKLWMETQKIINACNIQYVQK